MREPQKKVNTEHHSCIFLSDQFLVGKRQTRRLGINVAPCFTHSFLRKMCMKFFRGWIFFHQNLKSTQDGTNQPEMPKTAQVGENLDILRYRKDPKKNVLQSGVTRSNSPKYYQNVSKTVVWYLRICKRTYRIWRIASSANASEQSQILYVLYYVKKIWVQKHFFFFENESYAKLCELLELPRNHVVFFGGGGVRPWTPTPPKKKKIKVGIKKKKHKYS